MGNLTPFSAKGWVRASVRVWFCERSAVPDYDDVALAAVVSGWAAKTPEQKNAAAQLYSCRQCVITVTAKQDCQTASMRNSDFAAYLDPDTAVVPTIRIPDGLGGAIPAGKYVLQEITCEDSGQGGKSTVTACWEQRKEWVLVKNQ